MGLDISAHPVDVALFRDRITPFLLDGEPIDDLIERAAQIAAAQQRANAWGLGVVDVRRSLFTAQMEVGKRTEWVEVKPGWLDKLFGAGVRKEQREVYDRLPGLPGFDTDRDVWGRPFFIVGSDSDVAIADLDRYLEAAGRGKGAVDALAREMLARLEAARAAIPADVPEHMAATIRVLPSLTTLGPKTTEPGPNGEEEVPSFDAEAYKAALSRRAEQWRALVNATDLDAKITLGGEDENPGDDGGDGDDDFEDRDRVMTVRQAQIGLPLELMGFAARLLPGWMGRGSGYATNWLELVGVRKSDVFGTPEPLFSSLLKRAPAMREGLHETIVDNFSLGGYAPPDKIGAFVERLEANRDEMLLAWVAPKRRASVTPAELDGMMADYLKVLEPARYALKHGYGYVEAAEIYSGPLGWMN